MSRYAKFKELIKISQVVALDRRVKGIMAVCPFHDDSAPSMILSDKFSTYKCLACGAQGDSINYWAEKNGMSHSEALNDLCDRFNLPDLKKSSGGKKTKVVTEPLEQKHLDFLASRGIEDRAIEEFEIGASGDSVVFPQWDDRGKLIGTCSRDINKKAYKLSKGFVKDNLGNVFKTSKNGNNVFVTEGYIDCIQAWQENIAAVCTFGAELTPKQTEQLVLHFDEVILAFDNDSAGKRATINAWKSIKELAPFKKVKFARFDGKDLGEHLYNNYEVSIVDLIDWSVANNLGYDDIVELVRMARGFVERRLYAFRIADIYSVRVSDVFRDVGLEE